MRLDKLKHMDIHRYNLSGELLGIQDVSDWTNEDVKAFVIAIQKRSDGSYAALKERSEGQNEAR